VGGGVSKGARESGDEAREIIIRYVNPGILVVSKEKFLHKLNTEPTSKLRTVRLSS